ncbi:MAG: hypothetical protein ACE37D_16895 [Pseudomonadales bacterium]
MKFMMLAIGIFTSLLAAAADDTIYLEETVITGNQELPKVLYILPWREMDTELLPQRQLDFSEQSVLTPVYPDAHGRELKFRQALITSRQKLASEQQSTHIVSD